MDFIKKGRIIALIVSVIIIIIEIVMVIKIKIDYLSLQQSGINSDLINRASELFKVGIIRLVIDSVLLFFFIRGHKWAKIAFSVFLMLTVIVAIPNLISNFNIPSFILGVFYLICSAIILLSKSFKSSKGTD